MIAASGSLTTSTMTMQSVEYGYSPTNGSITGPRLFKKHKVLPHPRRDRNNEAPRYVSQPLPKKYDLTVDAGLSRKLGLQPVSAPTLKHQPKRIGTGPDLPPTPPAHSRNSSSSHSIPQSPSTRVESPTPATDKTKTKPPSTPPNQQSPPTPDVTPPQPAHRPRALRPLVTDRALSKSTATSRSESFKTAREDPFSSEEEEDGKSTVRPAPSARTSQSTVRRVVEESTPKAKAVGLGLGLESPVDEELTPRSKKEFITFDGEWGSGSEVEQEWDENLERTVTVKKRREIFDTPQTGEIVGEVLEDTLVTPTNATKALRSMSLQERNVAHQTPRHVSEGGNFWSGPTGSDGSIGEDIRRFSGISTKSTVSTVVEAILVDGPPRRQKTLRHIRKQRTLRDSSSSLSPGSSAPTSSVALDEHARRPAPNGRRSDHRYDSYASNTTINSISSGKARREVFKNGGIPVVIVPERKSSVKSRSSREPSLRSTSSRRSKRSMSLNSVPLTNGCKSKDLTPFFERPSRRSRAMSESDGSDQRTIDYPPVIPKRSSSLSAPTSRNNSRAGSLTAASLKAHNVIQQLELHQQQHQHQDQPQHQHQQRQTRGLSDILLPQVNLQLAPSFESNEDHLSHTLSVDRHGDPFFGKRLSAQNTPFSQASMETTGTAHELSEALAVSIFPHQNSSVLMVDHSAKPSEASDSTIQKERELPVYVKPEQPKIQTTAPDGEGPVTPPQPQYSLDEVDSPLRNPRAPPEPPTEPPAINFIPATPSGLTPAYDKRTQMGNYFEEAGENEPKRSMSLIRRALSRRRHSEHGPPVTKQPGFLTRTLSLSRNVRREPEVTSREQGKDTMEPPYPTIENPPKEGNKLHPFWRPTWSDNEWPDDDFARDDEDDQVYRYPPIDNRPPRRRSLSAKVKRTFAILPIRNEDEYYDDYDYYRPDRRTIRRTSSGNLRVMRHRRSLDSVQHTQPTNPRPYTAPEESASKGKHFWHVRSRSKDTNEIKDTKDAKVSKKGRLLPTISSKIEDLQNIPRRFSERRREKRSQELRQMISGPTEVRDGVGDVIRRSNYRDSFQQTNL
jgi:hypothetical protein